MNKLDFLDLFIKREKGKIKFEIYKKIIHTYRYISINSNHNIKWQLGIAWNLN